MKLIREIEVERVDELRAVLSGLPDDMNVYDAVGELLLIRIFEDRGVKHIEVS